MANRHPNKHVRKAITFALANGWRWIDPGKSSHNFGTIYCPLADREGCRFRIYSTPSNPHNHAADIVHAVLTCPHVPSEGD